MFLESHFGEGEVELHMPEDHANDGEEGEHEHDEPSFLLQLDEGDARIGLNTLVSQSP